MARAVFDLGGALHVIVPTEDYGVELPTHHAAYDALITQAAKAVRIGRVESDSDVYTDASLSMIADVDELLAAWSASRPAGTAEPPPWWLPPAIESGQ